MIQPGTNELDLKFNHLRSFKFFFFFFLFFFDCGLTSR